MIGVQSFRVLDSLARITHVHVTDVPRWKDQVALAETELNAGIRVVYLNYEYDGFCTGMEVIHTLYQNGIPMQDVPTTWDDVSKGNQQIAFQPKDDAPFPISDYEIQVMAAGNEIGRLRFAIHEPAPTQPVMTIPPAFGPMTIALGILPDGIPLLSAPDTRLDWNTKVVYAVFDYAGMLDGTPWMIVWERSNEEIARQEAFWDEERDGQQGTYWAAYYDDLGRVLPGGAYRVTLYIDNVEKQTAEFTILTYTGQ